MNGCAEKVEWLMRGLRCFSYGMWQKIVCIYHVELRA